MALHGNGKMQHRPHPNGGENRPLETPAGRVPQRDRMKPLQHTPLSPIDAKMPEQMGGAEHRDPELR